MQDGPSWRAERTSNMAYSGPLSGAAGETRDAAAATTTPDQLDAPPWAADPPSFPSEATSTQTYDETTTLNSSSRSLYPDDDLDYHFENGRRYCKDYSFPNDVLEQDRMRVIHQVYLHVFDLELTTVPLQNPRLILDIGTGNGEWAIAIGECFPECEVIGVDISALAPTAVPHNVFFEVDDCEVRPCCPHCQDHSADRP